MLPSTGEPGSIYQASRWRVTKEERSGQRHASVGRLIDRTSDLVEASFRFTVGRLPSALNDGLRRGSFSGMRLDVLDHVINQPSPEMSGKATRAPARQLRPQRLEPLTSPLTREQVRCGQPHLMRGLLVQTVRQRP